MDLSVRGGSQPEARAAAPSLLAYDRDHINALLTQLGAIDQSHRRDVAQEPSGSRAWSAWMSRPINCWKRRGYCEIPRDSRC